MADHRARHEVAAVLVSLRSALDRLEPDSAQAFGLLSRAVALLDEVAVADRIEPSQVRALGNELRRAHRQITALRAKMRRAASAGAEQAVGDSSELRDAERLEQDRDVLVALERGLALAQRFDRS